MIGPMRLIRRLRHLIGRARRRDQLDDEMRFHLDMLTASLIREGLPPEVARARAERKFGSITLAREETADAHGMSGLDDWWRDARFGVRALRRTPGFTALALTTLALGIGGVVAVFSLVYGSLLAPLPYRDADRLVVVYQTDSTARLWPMSVLNFRDWRDQNQTLEAMASVEELRVTLLGGGEALLANAAMVTGDFFPLLGMSPLLGRAILPDDHAGGSAPVVVLSHGLWQRGFGGDPGVLGRTVRFGQGVDYTIVGVMPPHRTLPAKTDFWASRDPVERASRVRISEYVIGRLRPDVSVAVAEGDLQRVARALKELYPRYEQNAASGARVIPLADDLREDARLPLLLLQVATAIVLLTACANLVAAGLARNAVRQREMAIRGAMGAGRSRLVRQLIIEHLVLGLTGGALGLGVAWVALLGLRAVLPATYLVGAGEAAIVVPVALAALGITVAVALAVGIAPAAAAARVDLRQAMGSGVGPVLAGRGRLAWGLVAAEVGFAVVLVVGTGLFLATLTRILAIDPGFDNRNVLTAEVTLPLPRYTDSAAVRRYWNQALGGVRAVPGVRAASIVNFVPLDRAGTGFIEIEHGPGAGDNPGAGYRLVADDYFETMGVRLVAGRTFNAEDRAGALEVTVINEAMARRYWPDTDPIGRRFKATSYDSRGTEWLTVIGVVRDVRYWGLVNPPTPEHYVYHEQRPDRLGIMTLVVNAAGSTSGLIPPIRALLRDVDPEVVPQFGSIADRVAASTRVARVFASILGGFAGLALLLAGIGVYGVLAYITGSRRREFGMRLALGAAPGRIQREVVLGAFRPILIGAMAGLGVAIALSRLIAGFLYGVSPTAPGVYLIALASLVIIGAAAAWWPARRMAVLDPAGVLRGE